MRLLKKRLNSVYPYLVARWMAMKPLIARARLNAEVSLQIFYGIFYRAKRNSSLIPLTTAAMSLGSKVLSVTSLCCKVAPSIGDFSDQVTFCIWSAVNF